MHDRLVVVEPFGAVMGGNIATLSAPLWIPWPIPLGWRFAGMAHGRAAVTGPATPDAVASCWVGHDPFGDPIEALFVAEEAGSGVGSHFAGLPVNYPTPGVGTGAPDARFTVENHAVSVWSVEAGPDRAVYAGEAAGRWLWVVLYPAEASAIVVAPPTLVDARGLGAELAVLPLAELSPRLLLD
jgi:hypothetical protein